MQRINKIDFPEYMAKKKKRIYGKDYMAVEDVVEMVSKYFIEKEVGIALLAARNTIPRAKTDVPDPDVSKMFKHLESILDMMIVDIQGCMLFDGLRASVARIQEEMKNGSKD